MIYLSYKNWDSRIKAIQNKALKKWKICRITAVEMLMNECILETQPDLKIVVIDEKRYETNRKIALTEKFNKTDGDKK